MDVYLRAKFEVSSIILTSFRRDSFTTPLPPTSKRTPKKPTQIRVNDCPLLRIFSTAEYLNKIESLQKRALRFFIQ